MQKGTKRALLLSVVILSVILTVAVSVLGVFHGSRALIAFFDRELADWLAMRGNVVQLPASGVGNTYLYSSMGNIRFMDNPAYPVYVSVIKISGSGRGRKPEKTISVESGDQYSIDLALEPGEYQIVSSVAPQLACCSDDEYWEASGPKFIIRKGGKSKTENKALVHLLRMTLLDPPDTAIVKEKRPSLQWLPVDGASYYVVRWSCERAGCPEHRDRTSDFRYSFAEDVRTGSFYGWNVSAFNGRDEEIARSAESSFETAK